MADRSRRMAIGMNIVPGARVSGHVRIKWTSVGGLPCTAMAHHRRQTKPSRYACPEVIEIDCVRALAGAQPRVSPEKNPSPVPIVRVCCTHTRIGRD